MEKVHIEEYQATAEDTSVSDGFDTDGKGVLVSNYDMDSIPYPMYVDVEISDGSEKRELDRLRDGVLTMKKEIKVLKDTILHQVVELEVLEGKCSQSTANLDNISEQLDVLKRQQKNDIQEFQSGPLREYIERACGIMGSQWYSGELV